MYLTPVGVQFTEQLQKVVLKGLILLHGDRHFKQRIYSARARYTHAACFSDMAVLWLALFHNSHLKSKQHKNCLIIHGFILQNTEAVNSNFAFDSHPTPSIKKESENDRSNKEKQKKEKQPVTVKASLSFSPLYLIQWVTGVSHPENTETNHQCPPEVFQVK